MAVAGLASGQNDSSPDPRQMWTEGQKCLRLRQWDAAEQQFRALLGAGEPSFAPFAHIGLATTERGRGDAFAALAHLREAERSMAPLPASTLIVRRAQWQIIEESARCHQAIGLLDLARSECDRMADIVELAANGEQQLQPVERFSSTLLGLDLEVGQSRWDAARRKAQRALADDALLAADPSVRPALQLRALLADEGLAADAAAARDVADAFDRLLADPNLDPILYFTARVHGAACRLVAGDLEGARRLVAAARDVTEPSSWERCEADALQARIALAAGATNDELVALRAQLSAAVHGALAEVLKKQLRAGGVGPFQYRTRRNAIATLLTLDRRVAVAWRGDDRAAPARGDGVAAYEHLEQAFAIGTLARRLEAGTATLRDVRSHLLPPEGGVLMWFAGPVGGHVLAIDRTEIVHAEFAAGSAFEADLEAVRSAMDHAPVDARAETVALRAVGMRLAERLLPVPIRARVARWTRVVVIGDETLGAAAWQAMPWGDTWLVLAKAVSHLPSASLGLALRRRSAARIAAGSPRTIERVVVADPQPDEALRRRFGVEPLELSSAQRHQLDGAGPPAVIAFYGSAAAEAVLADPHLGLARTLCMVAHGVQDVDRERFAGLLLAAAAGSDGILFADEVERLAVPPLCILGVCGASSGPRRIGDDGANHLGGAFLMAGADMVLVASGDLPLAATVELLGELLPGIAAPNGPEVGVAEALRRARLAVAATAGRAHPWYFSGLRAVGVEPAWR